ncbi:hypothetical protein ACLB2K_061176 [Fragaria x ananassa]
MALKSAADSTFLLRRRGPYSSALMAHDGASSELVNPGGIRASPVVDTLAPVRGLEAKSMDFQREIAWRMCTNFQKVDDDWLDNLDVNVEGEDVDDILDDAFDDVVDMIPPNFAADLDQVVVVQPNNNQVNNQEPVDGILVPNPHGSMMQEAVGGQLLQLNNQMDLAAANQEQDAVVNHEDLAAQQQGALVNHEEVEAQQQGALVNHEDLAAQQQGALVNHEEVEAQQQGALVNNEEVGAQQQDALVAVAAQELPIPVVNQGRKRKRPKYRSLLSDVYPHAILVNPDHNNEGAALYEVSLWGRKRRRLRYRSLARDVYLNANLVQGQQ